MRNLILIFVFIILSSKGHSQFINQISFSYGITHSDLEWNYEDNNSLFTNLDLGQQSLNGFYSGIGVEYLETKYLSLTTGFGFYQKGATDDWYNFYTWYLDYLTIDTELKAKYRFKNLSPYLSIGPRFDYLIKYSSDLDEMADLAKLNKTNYGFRYGIGLQYFFERLIIGIGWKNNINMNSVVENDGENIMPKFTINDKTMIFKCDIGFRFN